MTKILYIHDYNGNTNENFFKLLENFYKDKPDFSIHPYVFDKLVKNAKETKEQIESLIEENNIRILIGEGLGGFYAACSECEVRKILINPCMHPSVLMNFILNNETGEKNQVEDSILKDWENMECWQHNSTITILTNDNSSIFENDFLSFIFLADSEYKAKIEILRNPFYGLKGIKKLKFSGEISNIQLIKFPEFHCSITNDYVCRFWVNRQECIVAPELYRKYFSYLKLGNQICFQAIKSCDYNSCVFFDFLISVLPEN